MKKWIWSVVENVGKKATGLEKVTKISGRKIRKKEVTRLGLERGKFDGVMGFNVVGGAWTVNLCPRVRHRPFSFKSWRLKTE